MIPLFACIVLCSTTTDIIICFNRLEWQDSRQSPGVKKSHISAIRFKTLNSGGISGQNKAGLAKGRGIFNSIRHNNDIIILLEIQQQTIELKRNANEGNTGK